MDEDFRSIERATAVKRPLARGMILGILAFVAGLGAMYYATTRWTGAPRFLRAPQPVATTTAPAPARIVATPPPVADAGAIDARVARLEEQLGVVDVRARAASGNADRAEGLLVAFAARRALDRGVQLGYIESLLRDRFGGSQPQAVATILSAARQPVTLDTLVTGLDEIGPTLAANDPQESWWTGARRELAGLIVVRRASTPSAVPSERLGRATRLLDAGHVEGALAEVARMPGRDTAANWIAQARRYVAARNALDLIETAALLAPEAPAPAAIDLTGPG